MGMDLQAWVRNFKHEYGPPAYITIKIFWICLFAVETEPLDIAKIEGGFKPQVYKVFLEELRTRYVYFAFR